jgi:hypothetical protein
MDKRVKFPIETLRPVDAEIIIEINFATTLGIIKSWRVPGNNKI